MYVIMNDDGKGFIAFDNAPGPLSTGLPYETENESLAHQFGTIDRANEVLKTLPYKGMFCVAEVKYVRVNT